MLYINNEIQQAQLKPIINNEMQQARLKHVGHLYFRGFLQEKPKFHYSEAIPISQLPVLLK